MKRKVCIALLFLVSVLLLAGCGCEHQWVDANCTTPKTCSLCQETEGSPIGHSWKAATCIAPKTCENCSQTEGEALGHTWEAATCMIPERCSVCYETQGVVSGHDWEEATTETPKTCKNCQLTEGNKIVTDPRFTTASTKELHGKWSCHVDIPGDIAGTEGYLDTIPATLYYEFGNAGELTAIIELEDTFAFLEATKKVTIDILYAQYAGYGYGKDAADEAMKVTYGMTVPEYADKAVEEIDLDIIFSNFTQDYVYYVGQNGIYTALSWYNEFECSAYTLENDVLIIEEDVLEEGGEPFKWTRVKE